MRVKNISIVSCFLVLFVSIMSCVSSDEYEYSSDDTIREFAIDKISGRDYAFTIDQVNRQIFNIDSVPHSADTIINKILIKKFVTAMGSDYLITGDTLFHYRADSIDLSATMETPLKVKVYAPDGINFKEYSIEVRRHLQEPDSLVWGETPYAASFSGGAVTEHETKTVALNGKLLVFASDGTTALMYEGPVQNAPWTSVATRLPANANISSILNFGDVLYVTTPGGQVLNSADGINWNPVTSDETVETLLTVFSGNEAESLAGIIRKNGERRFASGTLENNALKWTEGKIVPNDFPLENISATHSFKTDTGMQKSFLAGKPNDAGATKIVPWFSFDGLEWARSEKEEEKFSIPQMERPTLLYYGKTFYVFGDDFSTIYTSGNGMEWHATSGKFLYPAGDSGGVSLFEGRDARYSMVVDDDNYIWMVWNKGTSYSDEVWRAKLNRL